MFCRERIAGYAINAICSTLSLRSGQIQNVDFHFVRGGQAMTSQFVQSVKQRNSLPIQGALRYAVCGRNHRRQVVRTRPAIAISTVALARILAQLAQDAGGGTGQTPNTSTELPEPEPCQNPTTTGDCAASCTTYASCNNCCNSKWNDVGDDNKYNSCQKRCDDRQKSGGFGA